MNFIKTDHAPQPAGHYSQAVAHRGWLYVSGQLPIDPETGSFEMGDIEAQTRRVLENLDAILAAAGARRESVVRVTVYVANIEHWPRVNAVYAAFFGSHRPARTVVPTQPLHHGFGIEIDAIAAIDDTHL